MSGTEHPAALRWRFSNPLCGCFGVFLVLFFFLTFLPIQEYVFFPLVTFTLLTWFLAFLWKRLGGSAMERMNQFTHSEHTVGLGKPRQSGACAEQRGLQSLWKWLGNEGGYHFPFLCKVSLAASIAAPSRCCPCS